ncbi:MAG: alpha/beta fold hydrolase [Alphaproteobacteria bacterium]|nr:alpha/beta fold hydrolase [Alphaproteobacteria bacterium]
MDAHSPAHPGGGRRPDAGPVGAASVSDRALTPASQLPAHSDVVVVGSGYGGSIAAMRLAAAGREVTVLEKGRAFVPGDFPRGATRDVSVEAASHRLGREDALQQYSLGEGLVVGVAVGLGGGSLINSGVALRPDPRVFERAAWPPELRSLGLAGLESDFERALAILDPTVPPALASMASRAACVHRVAEATDRPCARVSLTISPEAGLADSGVALAACTRCGECNAGCNVGAKADLTTSYIPRALRHGARFATGVAVERIERRRDRWLVWYRRVGDGRERYPDSLLWMSAQEVVLAAGALGTTALLLRSKAAGLPLSDRVGHRFSANGGALGFSWGGDRVATRRSTGDRPAEPPGPGITHVIDGRQTPALDDGLLIEDGLHPRWANGPMRVVLGAASLGSPREALRRVARPGRALDRTMNWLLIGHDAANGRVVLVDGRPRVIWPDDPERRARIEAELARLSAPLDAAPLLGSAAITVHPLGGAPMASRAEDGVVDHRGRVFAGPSGDAVHPGLFVLDGAAVPCSLGSNPMLTLCALAERALRLWLGEQAQQEPAVSAEDIAARSFATRDTEPLRFTERMTGSLRGRQGTETPVRCLLTIEVPDVDAMVADPRHAAALYGSVQAPGLHPDALQVEGGRFELFRSNPEAVDAVEVVYACALVAPDGRRWAFCGRKDVRGWSLLQGWRHTTTLSFTLHDGDGALVGEGVLEISLGDFLRQLSSWRVEGPGLWPAMRSSARFVGVFAAGLRTAYGGPLAPSRREVRPPHRPLRLPPPREVPVQAWDRCPLRLVRYPGGSKAPVLLLHGFAADGRIFAHGTTEACLAEALYAAGHEVWIGNWRASGTAAEPRRDVGLDACAAHDVPALVERVRALSGAPRLHVVAHCVGSRITLMALAAGYVDADALLSMVGLQVGLHWENSAGSWLRAHSRLPDALRRLGVRSIDSGARPNQGLHYRALDLALKALPTAPHDACANPSCRRNAAIWGQLFHHPNLRRDTHDAINELLGRTNVAGVVSLAAQMRQGRAVDAEGHDVYLDGLHRVTCPTLLLYSTRNGAVSPGTSQRTWQALAEVHGDGRHRWERVPGYGHLDTLVGRDAHRDVFPRIVEHLDAFEVG